jgi:hypothetical protein
MPNIRKDPLYDEPVNIDMDPEEALKLLLAPTKKEPDEN